MLSSPSTADKQKESIKKIWSQALQLARVSTPDQDSQYGSKKATNGTDGNEDISATPVDLLQVNVEDVARELEKYRMVYNNFNQLFKAVGGGLATKKRTVF